MVLLAPRPNRLIMLFRSPLILMVIQLVIIVALSRILHIFLGSRWLRQPRVLSEILAGVLLGPTAFGRIPGFSAHIFPHER